MTVRDSIPRLPSAPPAGRVPRVSVCLPVYNGEAYLRETIDSILAQTTGDLELILSDNASTDRTEAICREAVAADRRVRYSRSETNRGLAWNHNRAFELARGRYAMWIGHDDRLEPGYVARCVDALEGDPGAVLAWSKSNDIGEAGEVIRRVELPPIAESDRASDRYRDALRYESRCDVIFGLMRADALRRTRLHGAFHGSDWTLIAEMALQGRFAQVPEHLFSRRRHARQTSRGLDRWQITAVFDPRMAGRVTFPFLRLAKAFSAAIRRGGNSWAERRRCRSHLRRWLWTHRREVAGDLREGMATALKLWLPGRQVEQIKSAKRWLAQSFEAN